MRNFYAPRFGEEPESSDRQRKLYQLLSRLQNGDLVVVFSFFNFAPRSTLIKLVITILDRGVGIAFVNEKLVLKPKERIAQSILGFCKHIESGEQKLKGENIRKALLLAALSGKRIGREPMSERLRNEVVALLREGYSTRQIARRLGNRVSKSSVGIIARQLNRSVRKPA